VTRIRALATKLDIRGVDVRTLIEEDRRLAGFDEDVTGAVPDGTRVEVDPAARALRILTSA